MKTAMLGFLAAAAMWLCSAHGGEGGAPKAVPVRATQIERAFGVEFLNVEHFVFTNGKTYAFWTFKMPVTDKSNPIDYMGFMVPEGATDAQVIYCLSTSIFTCGWVTEKMKAIFNQYLQRQAQPSPSPSSDKMGIIYQ